MIINSRRIIILILLFALTLIVTTVNAETKVGGPWWDKLKQSQGSVFGDLSPRTDLPSSDQSPQKGEVGSNANGNNGKPVSPSANNGDKHEKLSPDDKSVSALIHEWVINAEPPINAKGAKLKYGPYGRVYGKAIGGIIRLNGSPDDVRGRTADQYIWALRDKLDSINHCTLGQYVQLRIASQSIAKCKGKYKANDATHHSVVQLSGLKGMGLSDAISQLKQAGIIVLTPEIGSPAKNKADEGKIERIRQQVTGVVHAGDKVTPIVWGKVKSQLHRVPDVIGLALSKAVKKLSAAGFKYDLSLGKTTTDINKKGRVASQSPSAGAEIKLGGMVKLTTFNYQKHKYIAPDLTGLTLSEASKKIMEAGFTRIDPQLGVHAKAKKDNGKVYRQEPQAGVAPSSITAVKVWIFDRYTGRTGNLPVKKIEPDKPNKIVNKEVATKDIYVLDKVVMFKPKDPKDTCKLDLSCYRYTYNNGHGTGDDYYTYEEGKMTISAKDFTKYPKKTVVHSNYTATFYFDSPPRKIHAGQTLQLRIKAIGKGFYKGGSVSKYFNYAIQYDSGSEYSHSKTGVGLRSDKLPFVNGRFQGEQVKESITTIKILDDRKKAKRTIEIKGRFLPSPSYYITWVYKKV